MFIKDKDSLYAIIKASLNIFYPLKKKQFHFLLFIIFVYSIIDVLSLSIIVPIIYLINDTGLIQQNPFLSYLYQRLNFQIPGHFVFWLVLLLSSYLRIYSDTGPLKFRINLFLACVWI